MKKIVILENDLINGDVKKLPYILQDFYEASKGLEVEIWDNFSYDVMQRPEEAIAKFREYSQNGVEFITYPSFCTYDSLFEGWAIFMTKLANHCISLNISVIYGTDDKDLLSLARERHHEVYGSLNHVKEKIESAIANHNIKYLIFEDFSFNCMQFTGEELLNSFKPLSIEEFKSKMFKRNDTVKVIKTGEFVTVDYVYYSRNHGNCSISTFDDNEIETEYKFNEIEKHEGNL